MIGLVSMGFVSASYLIESKGNAYNILRSVGFGKRNIASILAMQIFLLIIVGCVLGIGIGALCCQLFGKMYVKSKLGVAANLTNEVVLPMGYIAPTIVLAVSVLLVAIIVVIKIKSLFGKSIVANKQSE
ncbi:MAG: FtsX-like permease family protein [Clostridia bacterium]|nr:FtsX-like permease family protein [Clostridia bacterium]